MNDFCPVCRTPLSPDQAERAHRRPFPVVVTAVLNWLRGER